MKRADLQNQGAQASRLLFAIEKHRWDAGAPFLQTVPGQTPPKALATILLALCLILPPLTLNAQTPDRITLSNGQVVEGKIKALTPDRIVMELSIGGGSAEVPYQRSLLEKLELGRSEAESALLRSNDTKDLPALRAFWEQRQPYLALPESDAGEVGLKLARLLIADQKKTTAREALALLEKIEQEDWNAARRGEIPSLRVSALLGAGQTEKAAAELSKMETVSGADESAVASAQIQQKLVQANQAWQNLQSLEKEFPRWDQIPAKRNERALLIQDALDHALYPAVFHAEFQSLAAQGLFLAAEVYQRIGDPDRAAVVLEEIVREFPEPELVPKANELLKKIKPKS
jgi:hypothetical protein